MEKLALLLLAVGVLAVLLIGLGYVGDLAQRQRLERLEQENMILRAIAAPPPSSLDKLFPPRAEQPIFLFEMLEMGTAFRGIEVDLSEDDPENAKANFERFKAKYLEVSKLVPEWEEKFPTGPVEGLGAALEAGVQEKVMAAYRKVGMVCGSCHATNMVKVQQKYHWGDFGAIRVEDPLTDEEVGFTQLMRSLDANFVGISVDAAQGQRGNAQQQFQGFKARFQALKGTCFSCHDTERKYYVDEGVQALIDELEEALSAPSIDPATVGQLFQGIGMESCLKCHWVHDPAALAKLQWERWEKLSGK